MSFLDLFDRENTCVFVDEPARVKEHAEAVELEFRESMTHRLEMGYILPGQAQLLYSAQEIAARMMNHRMAAFSALDMKSGLFRTDKKADISVKSISSYNNSFEALLQDLTGKADTECFSCPAPEPGPCVLRRILGIRS